MILPFFLIFYKQSFLIPFKNRATRVKDFGFYDGGTYDLLFVNNLSDISTARFQSLILNRQQYNQFLYQYNNGGINSSSCDYQDFTDSMNINFTPESNKFSMSGSITSKNVYHFVLLNCNDSPFLDKDKLFLEMNLMNPNNQAYDYRIIPDFTSLPIMIGLFSFTMVVYISILIYFHRKFLKIHIFILISCAAYIFYLSLYYESLKQYTNQKLETASIVFNYLYNSLLLSTLLLAASGWCILNVPFNWKTFIFGTLAVFAFWIPLLLIYLNYSSTTLVIVYFIIMFISLGVIMLILYFSTQKAYRLIKAHLLVIQQEGINPKTTPIYTKRIIIASLIELPMLSLILYNLIIIITNLLNLDQWIIDIINFIIQFCIIIFVMSIYRPHGKDFDKYINVDDEDVGNREQISLKDINDLDINDQSGNEWNSNIELPLQPILISNELSKTKLTTNHDNYTRIND